MSIQKKFRPFGLLLCSSVLQSCSQNSTTFTTWTEEVFGPLTDSPETTVTETQTTTTKTRTVTETQTITTVDKPCGTGTTWSDKDKLCIANFKSLCGDTTYWNGTSCAANLTQICGSGTITFGTSCILENGETLFGNLEKPPQWAFITMIVMLAIIGLTCIGGICFCCCAACSSSEDTDFDNRKLKRLPDSYSNPAWYDSLLILFFIVFVGDNSQKNRRQSFSTAGSIDGHHETAA
eukprot:m.102982 g.102982  ORF g.102982 m.102982 type:complete len:236 (+) comp13791_c0_seq1:310-1017(+)